MENENKMRVLRDIIEQGKKRGKLEYKEVSAMLEDLNLDGEQIDKFFDSIENMGIEVQVDYVDEAEIIDDENIDLENLEEIPPEELTDVSLM